MAESYTVQKGDTLSGIAQRYNVGVGEITGYRSGNANLIYPGEVLNVGQKPSVAAQTQTGPFNPADVSPALKSIQVETFARENAKEAGQFTTADIRPTGDEMSQLQQSLTGGMARPTAPNMTDTFSKLKTDFGLQGLEEEIANLKAEERDVYARSRQRSNFEKGKAVSMNVIGGRVSEIQQQEQENLDFVQRQISFRTDQLQGAYNVINQMMQFMQIDYDNAAKAYESEFSQKMTMYQQLSKEKADERDFNLKLVSEQQNAARANLEIYMNMITKGNMSYDKLDQNTKLAIAKMETQSGLGVGFMSKLKMAPADQIKSITERVDASGNKYADAIVVGADGQIKVQSTYVGKVAVARSSSGGGSSKTSASAQKAQQQAQMQSSMSSKLKSVAGGDGYVHPNDFKNAASAWVAAGGNSSDFYELYSGRINPNHWWEYGPRGSLSKYFD